MCGIQNGNQALVSWYFNCATVFKALWRRTSVKCRGRTCYIDAQSNTSTQLTCMGKGQAYVYKRSNL